MEIFAKANTKRDFVQKPKIWLLFEIVVKKNEILVENFVKNGKFGQKCKFLSKM